MLKVGTPVFLALFRVTANILYTQIFHRDLSVDVFSPSYIFSLCELNFTICIFCPNQPYHVQIPVHFLKAKIINLFWTEPILNCIWSSGSWRVRSWWERKRWTSQCNSWSTQIVECRPQQVIDDFFIGSNGLFFCLSGHIFSCFMCVTLYGYM